MTKSTLPRKEITMINPLRKGRGVTALLFVLLLWTTSLLEAANPFVHPLFTSHMVLQRGVVDSVWGWTTASQVVTVTINGQIKTATAGSDGLWVASVGPFNAGGPYTLQITGPSSVTFTDVMIGDVWLCTGQSNMAYSLSSFGLTQDIADAANYPNVRCFTVPNGLATTPQVIWSGGAWSPVGASTTATGYFTARELNKSLNVPIGILCSAWPGTEIQPWLSPSSAQIVADFTQPLFDESIAQPTYTSPSCIYNAMIAPLARFHVKGALWYQGESNTSWGTQYNRLLPLMAGGLRSLYGNAQFPVIIVQLPNYLSAQTQPVESSGWADVREAQFNTVLHDSNTRLVTTIDVGDATNLHPADKEDVGIRASWAARNLAYGQTLVNEGPLFTGATVSGNTITCSFNNTGGGLMVGHKVPHSPTAQIVGGTLTGFAIAGSNKTFYAATATITGATTVAVSSPSVSAPMFVRYGWGNNPPCNLYNKVLDGSNNVVDGLPTSPFRNDPVAEISVNDGTGTVTTTPGAMATIAAQTVVGETFHHWSGDAVASPSSASTTATLAQTYTSVEANYSLTSAPTGLTALALNGGVYLSWSPMVHAHYNVLRSTSSGSGYATLASNVGSTFYLDTTAVNNTTYYYEIVAVNLVGQSPATPFIAASPAASRPVISVPSSDIAQEAPVTSNLPNFLPIVHYDVEESQLTGLQLPLYAPYDSTTSGWWDNLVAELLQARVPGALFVDQGYTSSTIGNANDPRQLTMLVSALQHANSNGLLKVGCYLDIASGQDIYNTLNNKPAGTPMDLAATTTTDWNNVFWLGMLKPFFDTVPSSSWYPSSSSPVIQISSIASPAFSNQAGNANKVISFLDNQFFITYGVHPRIIVDASWPALDPAVNNFSVVWGNNPWFNPAANVASGFTTYKNMTSGVMVPGFVDATNTANTISRNGTSGTQGIGTTLSTSLSAAITAVNALPAAGRSNNLIDLYGWTDAIESAGFYRSTNTAAWSSINQYINLVRTSSDLRTTALQLEAEACDDNNFYTAGNSGGAYLRSGNLDVRALSPSGWAVTNILPGGAIDWKTLQFSAGNYKFSIRYSSTAVHTVRITVDSTPLPDVQVPSTGGVNTFGTILLGAMPLPHGQHTIRLDFIDGGIDLDWLFVKKYDPLFSFKSALTNCYLTAESSGNNTLVSNRTAEGVWERFLADAGSAKQAILSGDSLFFQAYDGCYLNSINGGGGAITVDQRSPSGNQTFSVIRISGGTAPLATGDQVAIRSFNGHYLTVKSDASTDMSGTTIGTAQTFTLNLIPRP